MIPKAGKPLSVVPPTPPERALAACTAMPGERASLAPESRPHRPNEAANDSSRQNWIEIELLDECGEPAAGERYRLTLPDGSVDEGTLDHNGFARVEGLDPGECFVTFPRLDEGLWARAA